MTIFNLPFIVLGAIVLFYSVRGVVDFVRTTNLADLKPQVRKVYYTYDE